nr:folliculin [Onthophagus taurus]
MDGILALGHFCESHGPCVILCTQKAENPPKNQAPHALTVPWCDSCQSIFLNQALVSKNEKGYYVTTRTPLQQDLAFLLKQAVVRSLSCEEETSGEGSPIYFGDHERGHVLARTFTLQDSLARGFYRKYTILMLMRDKVHLLNVWPVLVKHIKEIVRDLKKDAAKINDAEQEKRPQRAVRQAQGSPSTTGRSLSELTGRPAVFAHLHLWFAWLLSGSLAEERRKTPLSIPNVSPSPLLRSYLKNLGDETFKVGLYCVLTGINLITESSLLDAFKSLLPCEFLVSSNQYCSIIKSDEKYEVKWDEELPNKLPTLIMNIMKSLDNKHLPDSVLKTQLNCLIVQWRNIVNTLARPPNINLEFLQSLGIQKFDLPLLLFWITGLCNENKAIVLKEQLNKYLGCNK